MKTITLDLFATGALTEELTLAGQTLIDPAPVLAARLDREKAARDLDARQMKAPAHLFKVGAYSVAEVRIQTVREVSTEADTMASTPEAVARFFREVVSVSEWFDAEKECVVVLFLTSKRRVKGWNLVTLGTLTASLAHPREVLRAAIVGAASSFVLIHNHPSGDPAPSSADVHVTRSIRDASKACDIEFTDHVIVGSAKHDPAALGHYSFRESGLL